MVAAYSIVDKKVAGLILESTAPSLSAALTTRLHSRWYLKPLLALPVRQLLHHDYSLAEALASQVSLPVVIFQGTADQQTPIELLHFKGDNPARIELIAVVGGTHSNTYLIANKAIIATMKRLLRRDKPGASLRSTPSN